MSFISHMVASLKHNKRNRISAFEKLENFKEGVNIQVSFDKTATPHQLAKIREKLQTQNKKKRRNRIILFTSILLIAIYIIGFVKFSK